MLNQSDILHIVREAFKNVPRPVDDEVMERGEEPSREEFLQIIKGKSWEALFNYLEKIDGGDARWHARSSNHMTPLGFHYFAPAFLLYSLNPTSDVFPEDLYCQFYFPEEFGNMFEGWISDRMQLFSAEQLHAIAVVINYYYSKLYPDGVGNTLLDQAQINYWNTYL